jgi:hypothetical protein
MHMMIATEQVMANRNDIVKSARRREENDDKRKRLNGVHDLSPS